MPNAGTSPAAQYSRPDHVTPRLQRVLDALPISPAIITTATWDVIAWNTAAARLLTDYGRLPFEERNVLRLIFTNPVTKAAHDDWWNVARYVVCAFRADAVRVGEGREIMALVDELSRFSPEFERLWHENDVADHAVGPKRLRHSGHGQIELEFSVFAVEVRFDLGMLAYNPATPESARCVAELLSA